MKETFLRNQNIQSLHNMKGKDRRKRKKQMKNKKIKCFLLFEGKKDRRAQLIWD